MEYIINCKMILPKVDTLLITIKTHHAEQPASRLPLPFILQDEFLVSDHHLKNIQKKADFVVLAQS